MEYIPSLWNSLYSSYWQKTPILWLRTTTPQYRNHVFSFQLPLIHVPNHPPIAPMVEVSLTVGKLDASLALLLTKDHHLIEFPTILLPNGVKAGSIVKIKCDQDLETEVEEQRKFQAIQDEILLTFGKNLPKNPVLKIKNITQTSCVLEWDQLDLGTATLKNLILFKDGKKLGSIPLPLTNKTTKLSGLPIDKTFQFQLRLDTTAGVYLSEAVEVTTHKMTDLSGITVCLGDITANDQFTVEDIEETLKNMGAHYPAQTSIKVDTTHFICTRENKQNAEYLKAADMNIPIIRPEWLKACERERRIVGVRDFYVKDCVLPDIIAKNYWGNKKPQLPLKTETDGAAEQVKSEGANEQVDTKPEAADEQVDKQHEVADEKVDKQPEVADEKVDAKPEAADEQEDTKPPSDSLPETTVASEATDAAAEPAAEPVSEATVGDIRIEETNPEAEAEKTNDSVPVPEESDITETGSKTEETSEAKTDKVADTVPLQDPVDIASEEEIEPKEQTSDTDELKEKVKAITQQTRDEGLDNNVTSSKAQAVEEADDVSDQAKQEYAEEHGEEVKEPDQEEADEKEEAGDEEEETQEDKETE